MEEKPNFYAIIPANIRYADITPNAKLLYGEITALSSKEGFCFASNQYFSDLYKVSKVSISKWIKELIDNKFIESEIIYKQGSKEILNRYLRIVYDPIKEKFNTPIKEKFKDNNTYINNIYNNNSFGGLDDATAPREQQAVLPTQNSAEKKKPTKEKGNKSILMPKDWYPKESTIAKLKEKGVVVDKAIDKFINSCIAKGYKYVDFDRAMLSWDWEKNGLINKENPKPKQYKAPDSFIENEDDNHKKVWYDTATRKWHYEIPLINPDWSKWDGTNYLG